VRPRRGSRNDRTPEPSPDDADQTSPLEVPSSARTYLGTAFASLSDAQGGMCVDPLMTSDLRGRCRRSCGRTRLVSAARAVGDTGAAEGDAGTAGLVPVPFPVGLAAAAAVAGSRVRRRHIPNARVSERSMKGRGSETTTLGTVPNAHPPVGPERRSGALKRRGPARRPAMMDARYPASASSVRNTAVGVECTSGRALRLPPARLHR